MKHVVMFSGGVASWATARMVADQHGTADLTLLFADTKEEDEDTYRFLEEAAANVDAPLVRVADGRDVWEVTFHEGMMSNSRVPICSRVLKTEPSRKWVEANCSPEDTTLYVGLDWTEADRLPGITHRWKPYPVEAPLMADVRLKRDILEDARAAGLTLPRLYEEGFPHANNGGACFRAGQAQWRLLLNRRPATYARWEANEEKFRKRTGKDVSILKDRRGGETKPLTLKAFRENLEAGGQCDLFDWGGCCDAMGAEPA